jgi:hypothetical protein
MKKIFIILVTFLIFSASTLSFAVKDEDDLNVAVDAVIVRPLGLVSIALGVSIFIAALPFTAVSGNIYKSANVLVVEPINFTFRRPIGDFDNNRGNY